MQNRINKILEIYTSSTVKIKDLNKLKEYVTFCVENDLGEKTKFLTAHHHILMKAKTLPFQHYENLNENQFNGVHLTHYDHYTAHYILCDALDEFAVLNAFIRMNLCDVSNGRLQNEDLIGADEYERINILRNMKLSESMLENEENERRKSAAKIVHSLNVRRFNILNIYNVYIRRDVSLTDIQRLSRQLQKSSKTSYIGKSTAAKVRLLRSNFSIIGLYVKEVSTFKDRENKTEEEIVKLEEIIERNRDQRISYSNEELEAITIDAVAKGAKTQIKNNRFFKLYHIELGLLSDMVDRKTVVSITRTLLKTSKESYLYKIERMQKRARSSYNFNLIGLYVEEIF